MNKTYIPALFFIASLAVFHYFGNHYYLYVKVSWYDVMMHIWGGIGIALSTYWIIVTLLKGKNGYSNRDFNIHIFFTIIAVTLIFGIIWEGMEAFYDMTGDPIGTIEYYIDTVKDLFNDVFGAIVGYLVLRK